MMSWKHTGGNEEAQDLEWQRKGAGKTQRRLGGRTGGSYPSKDRWPEASA